MDHQKLKGKLLEKQKTYADCAKALKISTAAFNSKMNGKTKFDIVEVNKLSKFLKLTDKESMDIFLS